MSWLTWEADSSTQVFLSSPAESQILSKAGAAQPLRTRLHWALSSAAEALSHTGRPYQSPRRLRAPPCTELYSFLQEGNNSLKTNEFVHNPLCAHEA